MNDKTKLILLTILLYGTPLAIFSFLPFFKNLFGEFHSLIFGYLFYRQITFSALGIIFDFLVFYCLYLLILNMEVPLEKKRTYLIWIGFKKILSFVFDDKLKRNLDIAHEEKVSVLFYFVKLVFTPVMINFMIGNTKSLIFAWQKQNFTPITAENIYTSYFYLIFYLILALDTLIFAFGYLIESKSLKNVVKSVEPTALGWAVALMCYPPFNTLTANIFGWYSNDFTDFGNINTNLVMGFISLVLFGIYVWATIALGFKASNLTNRGIVSSGPYKYIRHPAYISKNLSWWIMAIPAIQKFGLLAIVSLAAWTFIYFLRALTEERHLLKDQDYVEYVKKVKYMFVPGVI
jgi:protein-S-isoprenylcysteine O-methyltransferase Ste14